MNCQFSRASLEGTGCFENLDNKFGKKHLKPFSSQRQFCYPRFSSSISGFRRTITLAAVSKSSTFRNENKSDLGEEVLAARRAGNMPVYDPLALSKRFESRPFEAIGRASQIFFTLGGFVASVVADNAFGRVDANMLMRARELRQVLSNLGPTFVKLGQALSTRPDLLPAVYLEELAVLQDQLAPFPDKEAFALIEAELGMPLEAIFAEITPEPIAAASLGQVYKARLRDATGRSLEGSGAIVAVKVQRPGVEEKISLDFFLLRQACGLVDKYVESLTTNITALMDDFASRVFEELNYVQEGHNAVRFRSLYGDLPAVVVPLPVWRYTSGRVLVMDWIQGTKLSDGESLRAQGLDVIALVDIGIQCSLRQLLEYGYFHADPHPGNLLATADGRLAFLDFGMMSETPSEARLAIIGHVVHLVNRDYEAMARDYYALDFLEPEVDVAPIVPALRNFFDDVLTLSVSELNFKTIVDGLGSVLYQFPFHVPAYYALILRSLTVLEGLALYTDPNFKVLAAAYPYMAKRLLTDPNPYLRDALIDLLFKDGTFRWKRLENLLEQGQKDSEYSSSLALQPILSLLMGPQGGPLRELVEAEAIRVTEAILVTTAMDYTEQAVPQALLQFIPRELAPDLRRRLRRTELEAMVELRSSFFHCWSMLQTSQDFSVEMLQPILDVLRTPQVQEFGGSVANGLLRRLAARSLQLALQPAGRSSGQLPSSPEMGAAVTAA